MKTKKMSLANIQSKLSRAEMKEIMAGSGDGCGWIGGSGSGGGCTPGYPCGNGGTCVPISQYQACCSYS